MTHITGGTLTVGGRVVQRCGWCGAKLCDNLNTAMPLGPDGKPDVFPTWPTGRLVRVTTGNPTSYVLLADTDKVPHDFCGDLA